MNNRSPDYELLDDFFSVTKDKIKVHGFAMTADALVTKYPFYSVDSSTALAPVRYGRVLNEKLIHLSNEKMAREKDVQLMNTLEGTNKRVEQSVKLYKDREKYITALWRARGVSWNE